MEKICDAVNITLNKNAVHGDVSAFTPGGVRVGLSPLTSRSVKEKEAAQVAEFLHEAAQLAIKIQAGTGKMMKDFVAALEGNMEVLELRSRVQAFAHSLPMPGFNPASVPEKFRHA